MSLRTSGLAVSSPPISGPAPVTTLNTPGGRPARAASSASASAENGVSSAGLTTTVQPAASAGPILRAIIADGKVPGRDRGDDTDRLLEHEDAPVLRVARDHVAVDAPRLLGKPLDEGCGVADLAAGLGERLALLGGHDDGEVFLVLEHQRVQPLEHGRAILRGLRAPAGQRARAPPRWLRACRPRSCLAPCRAPRRSRGCARARSCPMAAPIQRPFTWHCWRRRLGSDSRMSAGES